MILLSLERNFNIFLKCLRKSITYEQMQSVLVVYNQISWHYNKEALNNG